MTMPVVIAPYETPEDIERAAVLPNGNNGDAETPILRLLAQASARGYESMCLPLTTDTWRARWHSMCVLSGAPEVEEADKENAMRAEIWRNAPAFNSNEVTVTRLGEFCSVPYRILTKISKMRHLT
jgi:protein arginine N-methyltransferase 5